MQELASLYGTIFATWKVWETRCRFDKIKPSDGAEWKLLCDAAEAEGATGGDVGTARRR